LNKVVDTYNKIDLRVEKIIKGRCSCLDARPVVEHDPSTRLHPRPSSATRAQAGIDVHGTPASFEDQRCGLV
jgi:hypothetical protein